MSKILVSTKPLNGPARKIDKKIDLAIDALKNIR